MYQEDPLHARCELLRDAAIATACEPALEESGLHSLFRLCEITASDEPIPLLQRILRRHALYCKSPALPRCGH